MKEKTGIF